MRFIIEKDPLFSFLHKRELKKTELFYCCDLASTFIKQKNEVVDEIIFKKSEVFMIFLSFA